MIMGWPEAAVWISMTTGFVGLFAWFMWLMRP